MEADFTLPDEDDAPWLDCLDGIRASIESEEPPVLADDGYPAELGEFVIT